jgi:hypothetical protein
MSGSKEDCEVARRGERYLGRVAWVLLDFSLRSRGSSMHSNILL